MASVRSFLATSLSSRTVSMSLQAWLSSFWASALSFTSWQYFSSSSFLSQMARSRSTSDEFSSYKKTQTSATVICYWFKVLFQNGMLFTGCLAQTWQQKADLQNREHIKTRLSHTLILNTVFDTVSFPKRLLTIQIRATILHRYLISVIRDVLPVWELPAPHWPPFSQRRCFWAGPPPPPAPSAACPPL